MFNYTKFLKDHGITPHTEGKNVTSGWTNIKCPMCDDSSNHGGFSPEGFYNCWACGKHKIEKVISALLKVNEKKALQLYFEYQTNKKNKKIKLTKTQKNTKLYFPYGTGELLYQHREYLEKRRFDPDELIKNWDIKATNYLGTYSWRIMIPIYFENKMVSYQGRDITDRSYIRYKDCKKEDEIIHLKHVLYGVDNVKNDTIIVTEGVTDVWRIGYGAVATFGLGYTLEQLALLMNYNKIFILFDSSMTAQKIAERLAEKLVIFDKNVEILGINKDDPAEMTDNEVKEIRKLIE